MGKMQEAKRTKELCQGWLKSEDSHVASEAAKVVEAMDAWMAAMNAGFVDACRMQASGRCEGCGQ